MHNDPADLVSYATLVHLLDAPCESEALDFKRQLNLGTKRGELEFAKDVLAFANSGGGHLVVGVTDEAHDIAGLGDDERHLRESKTANDHINKYTGGHVRVLLARHTVERRNQTGSVAIIYVPGVHDKVPAATDGDYSDPGPNGKVHWVFRRGDVYVRKGDESVKVETPEDLRPKLPRHSLPAETASEPAEVFQNPYDFATAATREMFKGRTQEIEELLDNIESGTHTAVFGLQRIGKTSLVEEALTLKVEERGQLRDRVGFAKLDFQREGTEFSTYKGVLQSIVRAVAEGSGAQDLQLVEDQMALAVRRFERGSKREMLLGFHTVIESIAGSSKRKVVVFLDEFSELCRVIERNEELYRRNPDRLRNLHPHEMYVDVDLMHWFSALVKSSKIRNRLVFVFGLRPFVAEYDTQKNLQLLKVTKPIMLYHLDERAAKQLITEPLKSVISVDAEAITYLYRLTDGHPYLLQFMLKEIVDRIRHKARVITQADVKALENRMISEGPGYDAQFRVLDSDYSVDYVLNPQRAAYGNGVLALIAKLGHVQTEGWVSLRQIIDALAMRNMGAEDGHALLDQLLRAKIIEEADVKGELCFRMTIPLLRKRYVKQNMYLKYFQPLSKSVAR